MIKRHYFMSARKNFNDGTGSFRSVWYKFSYTSWLADPEKVCREIVKKAEDDCKDIDGHLEITCFCRLENGWIELFDYHPGHGIKPTYGVNKIIKVRL